MKTLFQFYLLVICNYPIRFACYGRLAMQFLLDWFASAMKDAKRVSEQERESLQFADEVGVSKRKLRIISTTFNYDS